TWNNIYDLEFDPAGNVYLVGPVGAGGLEVDGHPLNAFSNIGRAASPDILLSSFSAGGQYRWSKVIGVRTSDDAFDIETDQNGSVYVSQRMNSGHPKHFDNDTIVNDSTSINKMAVLVKYDSAGTFQWLRMPDSDTLTDWSGTIPQWLEVAPSGTVHWLCYLTPGSLPASGNPIDTAGFYVIRYNPQGQITGRLRLDLESPRFAKLYFGEHGGGNFQYDPQRQRYYIGGIHWRQFDPDTLLVNGDTLQGNMFLLAHDANDGSLIWKMDEGTAGIQDFQIDNQGNIYLTGTASTFGRGRFLFDSLLFQPPTIQPFWKPYSAPYILKYDPNGKLLWHAFGSGTARVWALDVNNNEVALTGKAGPLVFQGGQDTIPRYNFSNPHGNAFIARFDRQSGQPLGLHPVDGPNNDVSTGYSLAAGPNGDYYLGGNFRSSLHVAGDTLYQVGSQRSFFLAHLGCDSLQPSFSWREDSLGLLFQYRGHQVDSLVWDFGEGGPTARGDSLWHAYGSLGSFPVCVTAYNRYCGDTTYCDTVQVTQIGLPEAAALASLQVYPNPTEDRLVLESPLAGGRYSLSSLAGQRLRQGRYRRGSTGLSLRGLPSGLYLLRLESA
ncbi:MAG: T9SS type A sorting domain-containing protein, partial [Schleiferiaceae bacterium]|nr:T9SS type A sorting domain-containing protein [Schleiferiaceae bacterium]